VTSRKIAVVAWTESLRLLFPRCDGSVLVQEHGAVESVALDGFEAGVADDAAELNHDNSEVVLW
jgi:hypothetical protein